MNDKINYLDQADVAPILTEELNWVSDDIFAKIFAQTSARMAELNFDIKLPDHELAKLTSNLSMKDDVELIQLIILWGACNQAMRRQSAAEEYGEENAYYFELGAKSAGVVMGSLLASYDSYIGYSTEQANAIAISRQNSINKVGKLLEAKEYVFKHAVREMSKVHIDGHNPSYQEVASYFTGYFLDTFEEELDKVPDEELIISWLKKNKPHDHNPRKGKKPKGYKSIYDS